MHGGDVLDRLWRKRQVVGANKSGKPKKTILPAMALAEVGAGARAIACSRAGAVANSVTCRRARRGSMRRPAYRTGHCTICAELRRAGCRSLRSSRTSFATAFSITRPRGWTRFTCLAILPRRQARRCKGGPPSWSASSVPSRRFHERRTTTVAGSAFRTTLPIRAGVRNTVSGNVSQANRPALVGTHTARPRPRGRPESHTAEAGWDVEWLIENGVAQAEARKLIAEHHRLSLPTVQRAHQRHLQVKKQEDITSEIQHHGLSLQAVQRIYQRHLQVMKRKVKKRKISRRR